MVTLMPIIRSFLTLSLCFLIFGCDNSQHNANTTNSGSDFVELKNASSKADTNPGLGVLRLSGRPPSFLCDGNESDIYCMCREGADSKDDWTCDNMDEACRRIFEKKKCVLGFCWCTTVGLDALEGDDVSGRSAIGAGMITEESLEERLKVITEQEVEDKFSNTITLDEIEILANVNRLSPPSTVPAYKCSGNSEIFQCSCREGVDCAGMDLACDFLVGSRKCCNSRGRCACMSSADPGTIVRNPYCK